MASEDSEREDVFNTVSRLPQEQTVRAGLKYKVGGWRNIVLAEMESDLINIAVPAFYDGNLANRYFLEKVRRAFKAPDLGSMTAPMMQWGYYYPNGSLCLTILVFVRE